MSEAWRPLLTGAAAERAIEIAVTLARRLREPMEVERAAAIAYAQSNLPVRLGWHPASVSMGYAGLALLFDQLDRCQPEAGWQADAQNCLELAVCECEDVGLGLFGGLAGVAMTTWCLSRNGERYGQILSALDDALLDDVPSCVATVERETGGMPFAAFDVVSGLAGIAAYVLARQERQDFRELLARILGALRRLWTWVDGRPRWHTPSTFVNMDPKVQRQFPHGNVNCGMAHGLPCLLAVLSLASLAGVAGAETNEVIADMADWLVANQIQDAWGPSWPSVLRIVRSPPEQRTAAYRLEQADAPAHNAWCYGSAGVASALALAGRALANDGYLHTAGEALRAIIRRPMHERGIASPTFCHGFAGLLQIFARFAQAADGEDYALEAERLFRRLNAMFEPDTLLGFRSFELEGRRVDQPGLLDGTPGIALALLSVAMPIRPDWDRIFLLS